MKVSVAEAKNKLTQLIQAVESGENVTICRHGKPVVDIVPTHSGESSAPRLGMLRGKNIEVDPDWWRPMSDEEVDEFLAGRF